MATPPGRSPPAHFVVIVPGYMGSRLRNRRSGEIVWLDIPSLLRDPFNISDSLDHLFEQLAYPNDDLEPAGIIDQVVFAPPLFKQEHYGRLLEKLELFGYDAPGGNVYIERPKVYTFDYDWRQDNRISARQLGLAIQGWQTKNQGAKAWLIAHSNGGIVSRWYIEKEGGAEYVERLFLMGSPWDGAPKAMQVLLDGLDIFLLRLFDQFGVRRRTRNLALSFPSYYQLIPYYQPFLRDQNGHAIDPFEDLSWLDNDRQRQMLIDGRRFNQELSNSLSVDTLCFFGVKKPTTTGGQVRLGADARWQEVIWDRSEEGDGTVSKHSAVHPRAREKLPFAVGHGDIYVNPAVLHKLEWELIGRYRLVTYDVVFTDQYKVQFEPVGDVFSPGKPIPVWATVADREFEQPVMDKQFHVRLEWCQGLPSINETPPDIFPEVQLLENDQDPGRYNGRLVAPNEPGYYRLIAKLTIENSEPVILEEIILVENEF